MDKKLGFTLVELMAVLVILGVILLMAMPSITNTFRNSEDMEAEEYLETICLAAKTYAEFETGVSTSHISIDSLISEGYVRDNLKVPDSQKKYRCVKILSTNKCELKVSCN